MRKELKRGKWIILVVNHNLMSTGKYGKIKYLIITITFWFID